ncbi:MAG: COX15/CtaA family protein [Aeropyrum sp.]|nr:COX15/CtaA family protein [Aeropyrum sp.]MCE4615572.1 COX15/CtaA family protein [Aeropyrum sp.]
MATYGKAITAAYIGIILLIATVTIGAFTRAYGAGMGCGPDWPTCNGSLLPNTTFETLLEYFHRVAAGAGFVALVYASYASIRIGDKPLKTLSSATIIALVAQIILGAIVVWYHLSPTLSALHTTLAIITVALAAGMVVRLHSVGKLNK